MPKKGFDSYEDEHLVEFVGQFRELYDPKHRDFRNAHAKQNVWKKIGEALRKDDLQCKKRWKDIRDNYWKIVRKEKLLAGSDAPRSSKKWALFDRLAFLGDIEKDRSSFYSVPEQDSGNAVGLAADEDGPMVIECGSPLSFTTPFFSAGDSACTSTSFRVNSSKKKPCDGTNAMCPRQLEFPCLTENQQTEDDVDLFMKSIAASIKKLPLQFINKAKMDILRYICELSDRYLQDPGTIDRVRLG